MKHVEQISVGKLATMAEAMYGNLVKAVVDVVQGVLVVDMDMHVDGEQTLLEQGSKQEDLWGINLKPAHYGTEDFIEFDSMINLRPRQQNFTRGVEDEVIRNKIRSIVTAKVTP